MKFGIPTLAVAALLLVAVAALPLASSPASAQIPPTPDNGFSFDDAMTADNATGMSFLIISGISMVERAEVTGVVMDSENEILVTITNKNETGEADAVTVVAFSGTMDIMSMVSSGHMASLMNDTSFGNSSTASTDDDDNNGPGSNYDDSGEIDDSGRDSPSYFDDLFTEDFASSDTGLAFGNSMEPTSLFENMKTGSSVIQQGWDSPQSVNVTLVGNATGATTDDSDTTFVFVMIVPYTEETTQAVEG